jgi:hypothetical protein
VTLIGHTELRKQLSGELPAVVLIEGPAGIGKSLVAREVAARVAKPAEQVVVGNNLCTKAFTSASKHTTHDADCEVMTAQVARHIVARCQIATKGRAVVFDAGKATPDSLNILLKLLEEPPPKTHFVLYASKPVLPTVASRATRFPAYPLDDQEVVQLLVNRGVPVERAVRAARWATGRPGRALEMEQSLKYSGAVLQLLRAAAEADRILLSNVCRALRPQSAEEWTEARHRAGETTRAELTSQLLVTALSEARSDQWRLFKSDELFGLSSLDGRVLDRALRVLGTASRSELKVRAAVEGLANSAERARRK